MEEKLLALCIILQHVNNNTLNEELSYRRKLLEFGSVCLLSLDESGIFNHK